MKYCLSCHSDSFNISYKTKDRNISHCRKCGLLFVSPIPSENQILSIVEKVSQNFYKEYLAEFNSYSEYFKNKASDIDKLTSKGQLLDIGCGPGTFLEIAKKRGWDVLGIDLSAEAIKICKKKKIKAKLATTNSLNTKSETFNVITAFQLIEHVQMPDQLLKHIFNMLKPEGYLILTTPDQQGFLSKIMGRFWFEYYNLEHLYFFRQSVLQNMVKNFGFQIIFSQTEFGRRLKPSYILDRLINYYYTSPGIIHNILKFSMTPVKLLDKIIYVREPWVNIYLIAQKN